MKTRLTRAIDELKEAAGGRPFVLVIDKAHPAAPVASVHLYAGRIPAWQALGLLADARLKVENYWHGENCGDGAEA